MPVVTAACGCRRILLPLSRPSNCHLRRVGFPNCTDPQPSRRVDRQHEGSSVSWYTRMTSLRRVLVVQRQMEHYRIPFFEALRREMPRRGCELILAYGDPDPSRRLPRPPVTIDWAKRLPTVNLFGGRVCIQPFAHLLDRVDAVVLAAENKMINNLGAQFVPSNTRVILGVTAPTYKAATIPCASGSSAVSHGRRTGGWGTRKSAGPSLPAADSRQSE